MNNKPNQIKPPITYFGNKAELAKWICSYFPEHLTYVEPFGGSASILLAKKPSRIEVYNDLNHDLVNLFEVIRDKEKFKQLMEVLNATPFAREEFKRAKYSKSEDPIEKARCLMLKQRQSHSGRGENWSFSVTDNHAGMSSSVRRWLAGIERIPDVHKRMQRVQIESLDWREVLSKYDSEKTLFYLDPPYILETRVNGGYKHELEDVDHKELVDVLLNLRGKVILSGYEHPIYKPLEQGRWRIVKKDVIAKSSASRASRVECLWISPQAVKLNKKGILKQGIEQNDLFNDPKEMMRLGAYHVHKTRINETTEKVLREIELFKRLGKKPNKTKIAESLNTSKLRITIIALMYLPQTATLL